MGCAHGCSSSRNVLESITVPGKEGKGKRRGSSPSVESTDVEDNEVIESESESSEGEPFPWGPLQEGNYVWRPDTPFRILRTRFGDISGNGLSASPYDDVPELTLTHFLGSGAGGTVYKASYCSLDGPAVCAVKFFEFNPEHNPDTHAALDLLVPKKKKTSNIYAGEKRTLEMLRPQSEEQYDDLVSGKFRLMQYVGFQDPCCALLLQFCIGEHPTSSGDNLLEEVQTYLKKVEEKTNVLVGDVKAANLIQDVSGNITVIDLGMCCYTGGATCKICGEKLASDIDEHASFHAAEYAQEKRKAPGRLALQEYCYGEIFC